MNVSLIGAVPPIHGGTENTRTPAQVSQTREIAQAVRRVNQASVFPSNREITFSLDPATKIAVTKLVDTNTREVIEQFPAEHILRLNDFLDAERAQEKAAQENTR